MHCISLCHSHVNQNIKGQPDRIVFVKHWMCQTFSVWFCKFIIESQQRAVGFELNRKQQDDYTWRDMLSSYLFTVLESDKVQRVTQPFTEIIHFIFFCFNSYIKSGIFACCSLLDICVFPRSRQSLFLIHFIMVHYIAETYKQVMNQSELCLTM